MMSNKVIMTYKRKRVPVKLNQENGDKTDIAPKLSGMVEDLNEDNVHCSTCNSVDVNENLLTCGSWSKSYHLRCIDPPLKYIPEEKWQCSACAKKHSFEGPMQHKRQKIRRKDKNRNDEQPDLGPMKLRSCKLLLNAKSSRRKFRKERPSSVHSSLLIKDVTLADSTNKDFGATCKTQSRRETPSSVDSSLCKIKYATFADDTKKDSGAASKATRHPRNFVTQTTNLDASGASNHLLLNSSEEIPCTERRGDDVSSLANTDASSVLLNNDEHSKENYSTPVITFSRRTKKKHYVVESSAKSDSKLAEEQNGSAIQDNLELAVSCKCADSSVNLSSMDHLPSSANLSSQAEDSLQPVKLQKISVNSKGSRLEDSTSGGICEEPYFLSLKNMDTCGLTTQDPVPSQSAGCVVQGASDEIMVLPASGAIKDTFSASKDKKLDLSNVNKTFEGQENKLAEEGCFLHDLDTSAAGDPFGCLPHIGSSKQTGDATAQNPLESQSSSTENCVVILVDEDKGDRTHKTKAMDISSLCEKNRCDKARASSSCLENNHTKCRQALEGSIPHSCPIDLSTESNLIENESRECLNNKAAKLDEFTGGTQLHEKAKSDISLSTNTLGLSLSLNPKGPENSIHSYDVPTSSLNLNAKGIYKDYDSQHLWGVPGEHTSILGRDKTYDNIPIGSQMLKEIQRPLTCAFKASLPEWSEEELDSLWIGVRRHGLSNWSAILRDPKLYFFSSRIPKDLAEQWDREQIKLLSVSSYQTSPTQDFLHLSGIRDGHLATPVSNDRFDLYGLRPASFQVPTPKALDTRLSLGKVYSQKEHHSRNDLPQLLGDRLIADKGPASFFGGCIQISSANPTPGVRNQTSFKVQGPRYDYEASTSHKKSHERLFHEHQYSASNTLPHWLKDALSMPPRQKSSILPSFSGVACSFLNNYERTPRNAGRLRSKFRQHRGILKRQSTKSDNNSSSVRMPDYSLTIGEACPQNSFVHPSPGSASLKSTLYDTGLGPNAALDLDKRNCSTNEPNDLVVIDSDASSEETISDGPGE